MGHNPYTVQFIQSGVGWPDFEDGVQRQILDHAEPPASFTVRYEDDFEVVEDDYRRVTCEITWCFARRRKDIFTSEVQVTLTRTVCPEELQGYNGLDLLRSLTEDERTACVETLTYEHRWSDVVTISFIPEVVQSYSWDRGGWDSDPDIQYSLELVRLGDRGRGMGTRRYVVQLPEWLKSWPDERRDRVDEALETSLSLQRYLRDTAEGEDIIEFELK